MKWKRVACVLALLGPAAVAQEGARDADGGALAWNAARAEHLLNRAGFGAGPEEIARAVALGQELVVAELLAGEAYVEEPFYARLRRKGQTRRRMASRTPEERREIFRERRAAERDQLRDFLGWWVARMVDGDDPLRERMTLFWHGHFTSSWEDVKDSYEMILQNQLLRTHALGSFRDLVHRVARDPAMLEYLDNDSNRVGNPNENFARELMELFTLGEGNYTEADVKDAARAFTGWTDRDGRFRFNRRAHDDGEKTVLGVTGRLNGDDVIDILLDQEACPRFLAGKLLRYLEGIAPDEARLERYADVLRRDDYDVGAFLRELFLDPSFYRADIVGARIAGPIDYLVGTARRTGVEPPPRVLLVGSSVLGQRLFFPPNVKGWEGGEAWITTASLMQRGNLAGVMLGRVTLDDFLDYDAYADPAMAAFPAQDEEAAMGALPGDEPMTAGSARSRLGELRRLKGLARYGWRPRIHLTAELRRQGLGSDAELVDTLCDRLLAIEAAPPTRAELTRWLTEEREAARVRPGRLLDDSEVAEPILRRLAHVILSLPEAQLH